LENAVFKKTVENLIMTNQYLWETELKTVDYIVITSFFMWLRFTACEHQSWRIWREENLLW